MTLLVFDIMTFFEIMVVIDILFFAVLANHCKHLNPIHLAIIILPTVGFLSVLALLLNSLLDLGMLVLVTIFTFFAPSFYIAMLFNIPAVVTATYVIVMLSLANRRQLEILVILMGGLTSFTACLPTTL